MVLGVGCGSGASKPVTTQPPPVEEVEQSIQQSLDRLGALHIVNVASLVLDLPGEASSCYGLQPCAGWEQPYHAERARQAPRLEHLASFAEAAVRDPNLAAHDKSEADAAIQALNGLAVVTVTTLVEVKPANNPQCYNLPCPADVEAADRINGAHVSQVFATVDLANKSGL